jgi:predicted dehydrogenase/glycine/D-amino acid oxidase-like deaminating enzyme
MKAPLPTILLIGVGHFGRSHLEEWLQLASDGKVRIAGLVVNSKSSQAILARETGIPTHVGFDSSLLNGVDAVDIVTPTPTHTGLVENCLPHAHVFIEKPLCEELGQTEALFDLAERHGRILMVGHLYHHHPLTALLMETLGEQRRPPTLIQATFTNPFAEYRAAQDPFLEWIHVFDLHQQLTAGPVTSCHAWRQGPLTETSIATADGARTILRFGWNGLERVRRLNVAYPDYRIICDYSDGVLVESWRDGTRKHFVGLKPRALRQELKTFLAAIAGDGAIVPSREQVITVNSLADHARRVVRSSPTGGHSCRPRVAVVGGGLFGAACTMELAANFDITLFERHPALLAEASYLNQWRHHSGFHYPRSIETIQEIQIAKNDFESMFEDAILRDVDAYFAVSAFGEEISRERYIATCVANGLKFEIVDPPDDIDYPDKVSVCLHTDEAVVEIDQLTRLLSNRLAASPHVDLRLGSEVLGAELSPDGRKRLRVRGPTGERVEEFDFLINTTYSNSNIIARWLGFPVRPLRFDLLEMAVYRIPGAPRFMMTLLDAPFTSLTTLGSNDLFLLSHIYQSVLASQVTPNGLPPDFGRLASNHENLYRHGLRYLPILKNATYVESRLGLRTVQANSEDFDGRPTVIVPHGFGCWSVLGGKLITAVTNARELAAAIARECA